MTHYLLGNKGAHSTNGNIRGVPVWRKLAANEAVNCFSRESLDLLVARYDESGLVLMDHHRKVWVNKKHGTKTGYVRGGELK